MADNQTPSHADLIDWIDSKGYQNPARAEELANKPVLMDRVALQAIRDRLSALTPGEDAEAIFEGLEDSNDTFLSTKECKAAYLRNISRIQAYGDARAAAAIPDGWQLVPKEPDAKMDKAGQATGSRSPNGSWVLTTHKVYRAMLAAAPQPEKVTK